MGFCLFPIKTAIAQLSVLRSAAIEGVASSAVSLRIAEAFSFNPASSSQSNLAVGLNYSNRFLLADLNVASAFAVVNVNNSRLQGAFTQWGNRSYNEKRFTVGISKLLSAHLSAGINFHYSTLRMAELEQNPGFLSFLFGLQYHGAGYGVGFSVDNPYSIALGNSEQPFSEDVVWRLGAHKCFEQKLTASCQLSWIDDWFDSQWGIEYAVAEKFFLRTGLETKRTEWSLGLGYLVGQIQTDLAFTYHEYLGFSPTVTLQLKRR